MWQNTWNTCPKSVISPKRFSSDRNSSCRLFWYHTHTNTTKHNTIEHNLRCEMWFILCLGNKEENKEGKWKLCGVSWGKQNESKLCITLVEYWSVLCSNSSSAQKMMETKSEGRKWKERDGLQEESKRRASLIACMFTFPWPVLAVWTIITILSYRSHGLGCDDFVFVF